MKSIAAVTSLFLLLCCLQAKASGESTEFDQLDINTASASELAERLKGIGPAKASRIVNWRDQNGPFKNIEQLQQVKGIGPKTVDRLRPFVRVGSVAAAKQSRLEAMARERKVRTDIRRIVDASVLASSVESIRQIPTRPWYKKSALQWLSAH